MKFSTQQLNIIDQCRAGDLGLWECPPFLFIVMGAVNIISIMITYRVATQASNEPELAALAALIVAAIVFVIGSAVVLGFNKIVEANLMKSEFIGIISHQLRSPLAIFKWTLNAFRDDLQKETITMNVNDPLDTLDETTQRMIRLVNMLLEVNRIESGRFLVKKKTLSLEELTRKSVGIEKNYSRDLNVAVSFRSSVPDCIEGDEEKLQMVIQNLLDNAIRYSRKNGEVFISIERRENHTKELVWTITDTGLGIPNEDQKYIFSKFFRSKNARVYQAEGNGIGLYIAKRIIEEHGGTIHFTSTENVGTTFWFTLPIARTRDV